MKRSIKQNIYGNWVGYEGRTRVHQFGENDIVAAYWFMTGRVNPSEAFHSEWLPRCKAVINGANPLDSSAWRYDAPFNPLFRGAQRPVAGEDY